MNKNTKAMDHTYLESATNSTIARKYGERASSKEKDVSYEVARKAIQAAEVTEDTLIWKNVESILGSLTFIWFECRAMGKFKAIIYIGSTCSPWVNPMVHKRDLGQKTKLVWAA